MTDTVEGASRRYSKASADAITSSRYGSQFRPAPCIIDRLSFRTARLMKACTSNSARLTPLPCCGKAGIVGAAVLAFCLPDHAAAQYITEFSVPTSNSGPHGITAGPDGALWFTEVNGNKIGRITTGGVITQFAISAVTSGPWDITAGPDGNLWFTESIGAIGRITTTGVITEFPIPTLASEPRGITTGPDGNLWFTESTANKIGRITTSGVVTEFSIPTGSRPVGITAGPDGNLWFTERAANKIGRITIEAIDSRILPVVGSTPGAGGTFFRTSVQLNNATST